VQLLEAGVGARAAEHERHGCGFGAEDAAGDGGVVEAGGWGGGGYVGADGEGGGGVDCGAVDEEFGGERGGEDAGGGVEVDGADVRAFGDHG